RLGSWPELSVEAARKAARTYMEKLANGASPSADRRRLREEETLSSLWKLFLDLHAKPRKRSWTTDERRWKRHLAQHGTKRLSAITTNEVTRWLSKIAVTSGQGAANRVRALLFTMFEKARREWGLNVPNPVRDTPRNPERKKDRYLLPNELRNFLRALGADTDRDTQDFLRLALFTGQRSGTLARARWEDINLEDGAWGIPGEAMKAGKPLLVPLASDVVELLKARRKQVAEYEYVFPAHQARRGEGFAVAPRKGFDRVVKAAKISNLTPHDLRRTFATWAQDAGAPSIVLARLLGHSPAPGMAVTSIYAQANLDVLRRWADATVRNMLSVAEATDDARVLRFPGAAGAGK
ncbi:MAG: tyrosine-type recombinase/integrase, partial [Thermoanaerobaculales bacterium]